LKQWKYRLSNKQRQSRGEVRDFELHCILGTSEPFVAYTYITKKPQGGQGVIFYIESTNLGETKKLCLQAGGTTISGIFKNEWNYIELLCEDSDGYTFPFYSPL